MDINNSFEQAQINLQEQGMIEKQQASPVEILKAQADLTKKEKELSLKNLKPSERRKILSIITKCKAIANDHYSKTVEPELRRREDNYYASVRMYDKKFPVLSEYSKWRSLDIMNVVRWTMPGLIEVFGGTNNPVDIKGVDVNDDQKARKIRELLKYQLLRKNHWFSFLEDVLRDALITNFGVAKVHWLRNEDRETYEFMWDVKDTKTYALLVNSIQQGEIEITEFEPLDGANQFYKVRFDHVIVKSNHPVVEYLPASEFRFTPEATNVQNCKFVAHRKIVQGDYLKRKEEEGVYQNVDKALEDVGDTRPTTSEISRNDNLNNIRKKLYDEDDASKNVELYECYVKTDYNNDGKLESLIVHCVGDVILSIQENKPDIIPFFIAQAERDSAMIFNPKTCFTEGLEQMQDLKTALIRQIIIGVAKANVPQKFIRDSTLDMDAVMAGEEIVPVKKDFDPSTTIYIPPTNNLSPLTMQLVQYAQNDIEANSGSTRYNQGLDSASLNKTATGIKAIMTASEKQNVLMARRLAENFFLPIFRDLVLLNQQFAQPEQIFRLINENIEINRNELDIDYDLIVDVGGGVGTKEAQIQYLMLLIQQLYPILEQRGIVDAAGWYSVFKDLLDEIGLRSTAGYLIDPNSPAGKQKMLQQAQLLEQQKQEEHQRELETIKIKGEIDANKAKIPRLGVYYRELPVETQMQMLKGFGLNTNIDQLEKEKKAEREYYATKRYNLLN